LNHKSRPLRIAILDHNPEIGGAEASILTLLRKIDHSQFHVTVMLPSSGSFLEELQKIRIHTNVIPLPMKLIRLKRGDILRSFIFIIANLFRIQFFLMKLCHHLGRDKFDLVLTNTVKAHLYGSIAAYFCSIPLVWRFHDVLSPGDFSPLLIKFIALFGKVFPERILAVSNITRDHLVKNGVKNSRVQVIFNGIDHERLEIETTKNIRNELKLENGTRLVGCIGRIIPQKGQKSLLLAIPEVIRRYPETFFLIIGDVFLKEEGYKKELLEIIKKNRIEDRVKFTGFRMDIGDIMKSLDILVFPSIAPESFGLSILEAMAIGKPVVASNTGGVSEIIEDGITGMLIEPNHPEQIADRIIRLFSDQEMYDTIAQNAKEVANKRFSLQKYVAAMEEAFREVVGATLKIDNFTPILTLPHQEEGI
jgi:glycosyltransferase involved in cell wall biosynthesis